MAIQSQDALALDALSILNDVPPDPKQPILENGVYLRWFPGENRAFPRSGGYFLLRRRIGGTPASRCLMPLLKDSNSVEIATQLALSTAIGTLSGNTGTHLKPLPIAQGKPGILGFSIEVDGLEFSLPAGVTTSAFTVRLRFPVPAASAAAAPPSAAPLPGGAVAAAPVLPTIHVVARFGSAVVFTQSVTPPAPPAEDYTVNASPTRPVDTILILGASGVLLDICYVPASSGRDPPTGPVQTSTVATAVGPAVGTAFGTTLVTAAGKTLGTTLSPTVGPTLSTAPSLPGTGWELVPNLTSAITLPLHLPSYPASAGAESIIAATTIAKSRFHYGNWADSFQSAPKSSGAGTVTLTTGSAIVTGSGGTNWTADLVGKLICVPKGGADYTAYAVMSVLAPDRAVLSRSYSGPSQSNVPYDLIEGDDFAELHDRIACLFQSPFDMRAATAPPILDQGTVAGGKYVQLFGAASTVQGIGTQWAASLIGCDIEIGPIWSGGSYFADSNIYRIQSVNSATQITLDRNFAGPISLMPGTRGDYRIVVRAAGDNQDANGPTFEFKPMDLLELACLIPSYAQVLGLFWIDTDVAPGDVFDYIVIADHENRFSQQAVNALAWLNGTSDFSGDALDGYVVTGVKHIGTPALSPPSHMELFSLPCGGARISIVHPDRADSDAGISVHDAATWTNASPGQQAPVMMNLWRLPRGTDATNLLPVGNLGAYQDLGMMVPSSSDPDPALKLPAGWPSNPPNPIHFIDSGSDGTGLDVGWYSYRANLIDAFGRWSPTSAPIPWTASGPPSQVGDAIHLEDRTPPPPPAGVLAWVLDDNDPYLVRDQAYAAWKAAFGAAPLPVGLRVQWRWPWPHQNQGPDLREFRIYFQSKPLNARTGRVTSVAPIAGQPAQSLVTLNLGAPDTSQSNDYKNASLQAGSRSFAILASHGGAAVQLTVQNGGPLQNEPPDTNVDAAIVIPSSHPLHKELLDPGNWETWLAAVPENLSGTQYEVEMVDDPAVTTFDDASNTFIGTQATWNGSAFVLNAIPAGHNLAAVRPGIDVLALSSDNPPAYFVVGIQSVQSSGLQVVPVQPPTLIAGTQYQWRLGPATPGLQGIAGKWDVANRRLSLDGSPDLSDVHAGTDLIYVATAGASPADLQYFLTVDTVDAANHAVTLDGTSAQLSALAVGAPAASLQWQIGRPVRYYEVFLPDPRFPTVTLAPNLNTSALLSPNLAQPVAYGTVGVSSADRRDEVADQYRPSRGRKGNESYLSGPATVFRVLRDQPPAPTYVWSVSRLIATKADYKGKSRFTVRWNKPATGPYFAHVLRAMDNSLFLAHWNLTAPISIPTSGAPAAIPAFLTSFAAHKTNNEYAAASALYVQLDDVSLWWLAALTELADAYTQVTIDLLDLSDPANQDRLGPDDDPATFAGPKPGVCAYVDTLDGKSTSRYFYRVMLLDGAQNRGAMGAPTPPVYLPKVVPPRAPVITKVLGGDRQITIQWALNREPDLAEYRVYRTDDEGKATDIRLMASVGTVAQAAVDLTKAGAGWTDNTGLIGGSRYYYRMVCVDTAGNVSPPTSLHVGVAIDATIPEPPFWLGSTWLLRKLADGTTSNWPANGVVLAGYAPVLQLSWASSTEQATFALAQRPSGSQQTWKDVPGLGVSADPASPFTYTLMDPGPNLQADSDYRIRVRSPAGVWSVVDQFLTVSPPAGS